MLVITRRRGQSILIGDDVVVTILETGRDQVRIGIRAPRSVGVHRDEVYQEVVLSNRGAAQLPVVPGGGARPDAVATLPRRPPGVLRRRRAATPAADGAPGTTGGAAGPPDAAAATDPA